MIGEMIGGSGVWFFIIVFAFLAFVGWKLYGMRKKSSAHVEKTETKEQIKAENFEELSSDIKESQDDGKVKYGGQYKCLSFREIDGVYAADFTTITKPVGEMYQFDPSCPTTGNGYIVTENANGDIVDYDPRQIEYKLEESPEYAWFAINWDIVKQVFFVPVAPWKSVSVWFAGAMIVVVFISSLAVLG